MRLLTTMRNWPTPEGGVECEVCEIEFGCFPIAEEHEETCKAYAQFLADQMQQADGAADVARRAVTADAAATKGQMTHMAKPTGKTPRIPDSGLPGGVRGGQDK